MTQPSVETSASLSERSEFGSAPRWARSAGNPAFFAGQVIRAAFSLVRFFWPRKRNELARGATNRIKNKHRGNDSLKTTTP